MFGRGQRGWGSGWWSPYPFIPTKRFGLISHRHGWTNRRLRKATGDPMHRTQNPGHKESTQRDNDQGRSLGKTQESPGSGRFGSWCVIMALEESFGETYHRGY